MVRATMRSPRTLSFVSTLALLASTAAPALAQAPRPPRGGAQPNTTQAPEPAPGAAATNNAAGAQTTPVAIPPPPSVDDPMLTPMPPATENIVTWEQALTYVRQRSTDLRIAYDEVRRAEARSREALAGTLFSLTANGAATHNILTNEVADPITGTTTRIPTPNLLTASANITQPLFVPRAWYAIGTAHRNEDLAKMSVEDTKRTIALGVANALIAVVTAERIAELNRSGFRAALERLDLTQRKKALGAATGLDVVRAQQDVEAARATLVNGDESLRQARESLGLALGVPHAIGVAPNVSLDGLVRAAQTTCKAATLEERADLQVAKKKIEVADRGVNDVWWQFSPTVVASSTLFETSVATAPAPNPTWNIQAILSIPLWEGGARYGFLREARVGVDEAVQDLEARRRAAQIQVVQTQREVQVAEQARKVAADARALAAETDRLTQIGYLEGQGTSLELVTAASALRDAEINLALRDFDVVRARVLAILALANCPF